jgi:hypothetical protein
VSIAPYTIGREGIHSPVVLYVGALDLVGRDDARRAVAVAEELAPTVPEERLACYHTCCTEAGARTAWGSPGTYEHGACAS